MHKQLSIALVLAAICISPLHAQQAGGSGADGRATETFTLEMEGNEGWPSQETRAAAEKYAPTLSPTSSKIDRICRSRKVHVIGMKTIRVSVRSKQKENWPGPGSRTVYLGKRVMEITFAPGMYKGNVKPRKRPTDTSGDLYTDFNTDPSNDQVYSQSEDRPGHPYGGHPPNTTIGQGGNGILSSSGTSSGGSSGWSSSSSALDNRYRSILTEALLGLALPSEADGGLATLITGMSWYSGTRKFQGILNTQPGAKEKAIFIGKKLRELAEVGSDVAFDGLDYMAFELDEHLADTLPLFDASRRLWQGGPFDDGRFKTFPEEMYDAINASRKRLDDNMDIDFTEPETGRFNKLLEESGETFRWESIEDDTPEIRRQRYDDLLKKLKAIDRSKLSDPEQKELDDLIGMTEDTIALGRALRRESQLRQIHINVYSAVRALPNGQAIRVRNVCRNFKTCTECSARVHAIERRLKGAN